jgi:hypothetical protein
LDGRRRAAERGDYADALGWVRTIKAIGDHSHPVTRLSAKRGEAHSPETVQTEKSLDDRLDR